MYGRHPLGREIAGTIGAVRRATHEGVVSHWRSAYRPASMILAVAGAIDHDEVVAVADEWRADGPDEDGLPALRPPVPAPAPAAAASGSLRVSYRRLSQGNLCIGMPGVARDDPDRWALDLLGAILGDGMGSRLFLELRERRSLVYDISTFSATYADAGTFGVHAGFDPDDSDAVVRAILDQLDRIATDPVVPERARACEGLHPRPPRAADGGFGRRRRLDRHGRDAPAAHPHRGRGHRAARGGHGGGRASRRPPLRSPRPKHALRCSAHSDRAVHSRRRCDGERREGRDRRPRHRRDRR